MEVENAARAGVEFALTKGTDEDALLAAILASFFPEEYADDPTLASFDTDITETCECANGVVIACTDTCADDDDYRRRYLEVSFGYNYNMSLPYPGVTDDGVVYLQGTARLQKD